MSTQCVLDVQSISLTSKRHPLVQPFWNELVSWFNNIYGTNWTLSTKEIIYGILDPKQITLNFSLIYGKWFIHFEIHKTIAVKKNNMEIYKKTFKSLMMPCIKQLYTLYIIYNCHINIH